MSYQSIGFLIFSAAVVLVYYLLGRRMQRWVLLLANLIFFVSADLKYLPFLAGTMLATYIAGRVMGGIYQKADAALAACTDAAEKKALRNQAKAKAKRALVVCMVLTIGILAVCKYTTFVLTNINSLLAALNVPQITLFKMIVPIGISFYTFMALSYVLDVYWKRYPAEKNFVTYAVYLSYFPHVVQGPIDRFNEFKEQIKDGVAFDTKNLAFGAELTLWGFFKKLVIADRLGIFVSKVFDNWAECDGLILILALLAYSVQIYCDFSGCIDIVTGVSEAMGIKLRRNFNHPYFSKTMGEFWRRWHISLQEWFKDYVYYPVSASGMMRKVKKHFNNKQKPQAAGLFSACFPILVVWLITGIWHGASWNFVIWGIFHACLLIGSQVFEPLFKKLTALLRIDTENFGWHFWQMTRTFLLCGVGRIFFRSANFGDAMGYIGGIFSGMNLGNLYTKLFTYGLDAANVFIAIIAILVLWGVDMLQEKMKLRETIAKQNIVFRWLIIFIALFAVIIVGIYGPGYDASSFIYEQF